ncbi:FAD-dependent oxidoreductase [Candidatus Daviesbacteria bacterium]|nr:FAD-dependent oxidoreductase [Candidatus Daviesbacteria bacterium]
MQLTLQSKKEEVPGVISFVFQPAQPISWQAGQFLEYTLEHPNPDERGVKRYFTIASAPYEQKVMLTTRFTKDTGSSFKKALFALEVGQTLEAEGPKGSFVINDPNQTYVFISGGIGITPFRSILLDLAHKNQPINITLLYANRDENIVFKDELESLLPNYPNFKIQYFIGESNQLDQEKLQKMLDTKIISLNYYFYVSGPEPMVQSLEKILSDLQVLDERLKRDFFPGYDWPMK